MAFSFTLQQKHNKFLLDNSMDTMSYSQIMFMVDLISKRGILAYGLMELMLGGLEWMKKKDSHMAMHSMSQMYFAHINYLIGSGWF